MFPHERKKQDVVKFHEISNFGKQVSIQLRNFTFKLTFFLGENGSFLNFNMITYICCLQASWKHLII